MGANDDFLEILRTERRDLLQRLRQTRFSELKPGYTHTQVIPYATYSPWADDRQFQAVYEQIKGFTLVDVYRCYELYTLTMQLRGINGDLVEVGVWRGGTAAVLGSAASHRTVHLFDTFQGVVKADGHRDTLYVGGEHADTDHGIVEGLLQRLDVSYTLNAGVFPEETGRALPPHVCLAHIDVDTYASAMQSFQAIWPALAQGGLVVFDDYGFFGCEGVTEAVREIKNSLSHALFVHNLNGHGIFVKTSG